jgi:hypothetical protein
MALLFHALMIDDGMILVEWWKWLWETELLRANLASLLPLHNRFRMKSHAIDPSSAVPIRRLNIWAKTNNITKRDVQYQFKRTAVQLIKTSRVLGKNLPFLLLQTCSTADSSFNYNPFLCRKQIPHEAFKILNMYGLRIWYRNIGHSLAFDNAK